MSHEISTLSSGMVEAAWSGDRPWHGLGVELPAGIEIIEAARGAGILWEVSKHSLFTIDYTAEEELCVPGYYATVREDNGSILGVVRKGYKVIQNAEIVEIASAINAEFSMTAALDSGKRLFICLRIPEIESKELSDGDALKSWVLLSWGHDGSTPIRVGLVPIRVVCQNTITAALGGFTGFVIKHLPSAEKRIQLAGAVLNNAIAWHKDFIAFAEECKRYRMTEEGALSYFKQVLGVLDRQKVADSSVQQPQLPSATASSRTLRTLQEIFATSPGAENSLWGSFNAISYYTDHEMKTRKEHLSSLLFARGGHLKVSAMKHAMKMLQRKV